MLALYDLDEEEQAKAEAHVRIVLRPYASALPLASFAFGIGNVLYSAYLLGWIPGSESKALALMLLAFVAPLELVPCVMGFLSRDTGGATAFGIFGAAWIVQGLQLLGGGGMQPSAADGFFLGLLALCLAILAAVTFGGKPMLGGLLVVAVLRTGCAAAVSFGVAGLLPKVAAGLGLALAALAFYAGVAFLAEDVLQTILPFTVRSGDAKAAMEGKLRDQVDAVTREAGVRKQL